MNHQIKSNDYRHAGAMPPAAAINQIVPAPTSHHSAGKKSFLVYKHNKYITVSTEQIAFFYIKYEVPIIVTFTGQEYPVNYSLDQVQQLLSADQFFRLNRQYLINFTGIKEVEHYFARKLLVIPVIPFSGKLLVSKEKARLFLDWLENR